jgi:hypothetical protein
MALSAQFWPSLLEICACERTSAIRPSLIPLRVLTKMTARVRGAWDVIFRRVAEEDRGAASCCDRDCKPRTALPSQPLAPITHGTMWSRPNLVVVENAQNYILRSQPRETPPPRKGRTDLS